MRGVMSRIILPERTRTVILSGGPVFHLITRSGWISLLRQTILPSKGLLRNPFAAQASFLPWDALEQFGR